MLSAALARLAESGFVSDDAGKNPETGADIREKKYRLRDNYARFYLKYVAPVKRVIDTGLFKCSGIGQFSGWDAIKGLQFENLIVYEGELAPSVEADGFFDAIVRFRDLLGI